MDATERTTQADKLVKRYALGSLLPGLLPIPWLDLVLVSGVQLKMLQRLANLYETEFRSELARAAIASLVGGATSVSLAALATPLLRPVPGIGQIAGVATLTAFGTASTYAVGRVFIQHFESGGTLLTFDAEKVRAHYRELCTQAPAEIASGPAGIKPP